MAADPSTMSQLQLHEAQSHLRILSGNSTYVSATSLFILLGAIIG